jgi:hypothetical protein
MLIVVFAFAVLNVVMASNYNIAGGLAEIQGNFIKFNGHVPILVCKKSLEVDAFCTTNYQVISRLNNTYLCKNETCFVNISCATILNSENLMYLPTFRLTNEVCDPVQNVTGNISTLIFGCNISQLYNDGLLENINSLVINSLTKYSFSIVNGHNTVYGHNSVNVCKIENYLNMLPDTMINDIYKANFTFSDSCSVLCQSLTDVTYQNSQAELLKAFEKKKFSYFEFFGAMCILFLWMIVGAFIEQLTFSPSQ